MDPLILILLGVVLLALPIVLFYGLIWVALFIFVWTNAYPWLKMVGKFAARPLNLASLVLLYVLLLAVQVFVYIQFTGSSGVTSILLILLLLLLLVPLFIAYLLLFLAIVVWYVRLIKWFYARWRGWIEGVYFSARLQLIKRKIKTDMMQETAFRVKPGTSRKPGTGTGGKSSTGLKTGKKGMGFKEKLDALKSEFSAEVQRARNKLSRRK